MKDNREQVLIVVPVFDIMGGCCTLCRFLRHHVFEILKQCPRRRTGIYVADYGQGAKNPNISSLDQAGAGTLLRKEWTNRFVDVEYMLHRLCSVVENHAAASLHEFAFNIKDILTTAATVRWYPRVQAANMGILRTLCCTLVSACDGQFLRKRAIGRAINIRQRCSA